MTAYASLVPLSQDQGLAHYMHKIKRFPILEPEEEYHLAQRWRTHQDRGAAHRLVTSHLRLVAKISMSFRGYGLPMNEVISEGTIGLMQAVKRFDPEKGVRLATYAMWWIKASIQEFVLRSWSLVRLGTTAAQKRLFFGLKRAKRKIDALDDHALRADQIAHIASELKVSSDDVITMNARLSGDTSLNASVREEGGELQDFLKTPEQSQEESLVEREEASLRTSLLAKALEGLSPRERAIFRARRLADPAQTLEDLSIEHGISRERVRQIEARAFEKVQGVVMDGTKLLEGPK